ncbi:MAG: hydroxyacylglutathione hydrolase [Burkholderiales bacterium]|nr:hydroxyacylglutathione hydrolase [Burkholderiales bacterium]MDE2395102.1 hydroxyacylglutathione hydrolase [Burkholderiales bacterium]MDE2454319.1 hydroxyacylglutathione hydrolase [Burkholderiales bacterium]
MKLVALPAFTDNYIWMLHNGREAVVVDPGDAAPVSAALDAQGLQLAAILVTHHHADHVGGVDALRPRLRGRVYGPARERIPQPFVALEEGAQVEVLGLAFEVIDVPGHTAGHIAYVQRGVDRAPILFCGDTLFSGGCGRLFEGTPQQMAASLARLNALPADARVCCTHEYTLANLRFAAAVEPGNRAIAAYTESCLALREAGRPTLPSTLETERAINPFLRCSEAAVAASARAQGARNDDSVEIFATLREWKNRFR